MVEREGRSDRGGKGGKKGGSKQWKQRRSWWDRDVYVKASRRDGYRARSIYKLSELDASQRFLRAGVRVVDLGAAPGSWSQYIAERVGAERYDPPRIIAVDRLPMESIGGVTIVEEDIFADDLEERLRVLLCGEGVDCVVSDALPSATGRHDLDHIRSVALCERVLELSLGLLLGRGVMVCKLLQGGDEPAFFDQLRGYFREVKRLKPGASRRSSSEIYIWARGLRGGAGAEAGCEVGG